jgi:hypothetical protein
MKYTRLTNETTDYLARREELVVAISSRPTRSSPRGAR